MAYETTVNVKVGAKTRKNYVPETWRCVDCDVTYALNGDKVLRARFQPRPDCRYQLANEQPEYVLIRLRAWDAGCVPSGRDKMNILWQKDDLTLALVTERRIPGLDWMEQLLVDGSQVVKLPSGAKVNTKCPLRFKPPGPGQLHGTWHLIWKGDRRQRSQPRLVVLARIAAGNVVQHVVDGSKLVAHGLCMELEAPDNRASVYVDVRLIPTND